MPTVPISIQTEGSVSWWRQFIRPVLTREHDSLNRPPAATFLAYTLPVLIFASTVFACTYWMYSSEYFVEQIHRKAEKRARTSEDRETIELAREATNRALKNPAFRTVLSLDVVLVAGRSMLLLTFTLWLLLSIIAEKWGLFLPFWLLASTSTSVLSLGVFINTFMKIVLPQENVVIGPIWFFSTYEPTSPFYVVLARFDLFSLWFLALLSSRSSGIFRERFLLTFMLSTACLMILLLLSSLLDFRFFLT